MDKMRGESEVCALCTCVEKSGKILFKLPNRNLGKKWAEGKGKGVHGYKNG